MGTFTRGDVVLFPFPFTDLRAAKLRPCLVLSPEMDRDILLCQITSKKIAKNEYSVELKKKDTLMGSLMIDSYIRCNMLFTADVKNIRRKICNLREEDYDQVVSKITSLVSLS